MRSTPVSTNMISTLAMTAFLLFMSHGALAKTIINVDLYYESLCGDSISFIGDQLVPSYPHLREHLKVNFVPYGKATQRYDGNTENWSFECQHGRNECNGNKAHACALDAIEKNERVEDHQRLSVDLVGCVMSSFYPNTAVSGCAETVGLKAETKSATESCVESKMAGKLLADHGIKTAAVQAPLAFVPTIVLDGVYSSENQRGALRNFKKLICDKIPQEEKPTTCGV